MKEIGLLDEYRHVIEVPVAWGDMDSLEHLNNVIYFRYFETARIAYFIDADLGVPRKSEVAGPVLAQIDCQFKAPVVFPDTVKIGTKIVSLGSTSIKVVFTAVSTRTRQVAATGSCILVMVDYRTGQKVEIDDLFRAKAVAFEQTQF